MEKVLILDDHYQIPVDPCQDEGEANEANRRNLRSFVPNKVVALMVACGALTVVETEDSIFKGYKHRRLTNTISGRGYDPFDTYADHQRSLDTISAAEAKQERRRQRNIRNQQRQQKV